MGGGGILGGIELDGDRVPPLLAQRVAMAVDDLLHHPALLPGEGAGDPEHADLVAPEVEISQRAVEPVGLGAGVRAARLAGLPGELRRARRQRLVDPVLLVVGGGDGAQQPDLLERDVAALERLADRGQLLGAVAGTEQRLGEGPAEAALVDEPVGAAADPRVAPSLAVLELRRLLRPLGEQSIQPRRLITEPLGELGRPHVDGRKRRSHYTREYSATHVRIATPTQPQPPLRDPKTPRPRAPRREAPQSPFPLSSQMTTIRCVQHCTAARQPHTRPKNKHNPDPDPNGRPRPYGVSRSISRGNSVASRMFPNPSRRIVSRSSPIANPPCGGIPNLCINR